MTHVFLLWHTHHLPDAADDVKLIGVYPTRRAAMAAKSRATRLSGFAGTPKGFVIDAYEVGKDSWTEGFVTVKQERR